MIGKKSCKLANSLASDACERKLSFTEWCRMNIHLLMCRSCRNCKQEMLMIHDILARVRRKNEMVEVDLPQKDRELIRDALRKIPGKR